MTETPDQTGRQQHTVQLHDPAPKRTGRPPLTDAATILSAARAIGYGDLTVGAVTKAVGVRYSTFYRHYPSLAALQSAMAAADLRDVDWPTWGDGFDAFDALNELGDALVALDERRPGVGAVLLALTDDGDEPPEPPGESPATDHLGLPARLRDERDAAVKAIMAAGATPDTAWPAVRGILHDALAPAFGQTRGRETRRAMIAIRVDGVAARIDGVGR